MRDPGSPIHIAICVPTHFKVDALFAYDMAQMMAFTTAVMPENCSIGLHMNIGTYIHKSRTELLQDALSGPATHILWLDSDMRFPQDAAIRLLQRQVSFVGCNYSTGRMPPEFVGIKHIPLGDDPWDGERLKTNDDSTGLEEVDALGFGVFMMEAAALRDLPDPNYTPWFWFEKTRFGHEIGEDVYFCLKMVKEHLNERVFVDHDLTKHVSHIGGFEYKFYHPLTTESVRDTETEPAEAQQGTGNGSSN